MSGSLITDLEQRVRDRVAELEPFVVEHRQLRQILAAIHAARADTSVDGASPRRRRTSGPRAEQALALVTERPGITVAELADAMGIGPPYLYRVMPALERDGKVAKVGRGYRPLD